MEWNSFPTHSDLNLPQVRRELFQERTGAKSSYATPYDAFVALVEKIVKETNVFASRLLARMTAQGLMRLNSRIARWKDTNVDEILDESLVQWCGWLSFKQFIKDKAAAVGIKTYEVCESETGYLWRFEVHADKLSADPKVETEVAVSSGHTPGDGEQVAASRRTRLQRPFQNTRIARATRRHPNDSAEQNLVKSITERQIICSRRASSLEAQSYLNSFYRFGDIPCHRGRLTPMDFLCGYLKERVYNDNPQTLVALKKNIRREISSIEPSLLQRVAHNTKVRFEHSDLEVNICLVFVLHVTCESGYTSGRLSPRSACQRSMIRIRSSHDPQFQMLRRHEGRATSSGGQHLAAFQAFEDYTDSKH
ncbi:hypothetical protein EVAR_87975_1 [Eumeta japonica]|uniref:PiggyBac transposable element-derived protein domain-containing protein n=1 Tax=Eumeta variegata TaxID=151549 RepID=A0A4C1VC88_EUMVA|nr:hypothetical protein EVAR_87975_1 [Eumeta japonica]